MQTYNGKDMGNRQSCLCVAFSSSMRGVAGNPCLRCPIHADLRFGISGAASNPTTVEREQRRGSPGVTPRFGKPRSEPPL